MVAFPKGMTMKKSNADDADWADFLSTYSLERIMRKFWLVLGLVVLGFLVGGCGGDEGGTATVVGQRAVERVGDAAAGEALFQTTCFACHGTDATGLPGQGKDLTTSTFTRGLSDTEFVTFVKNGRKITDPLNTTGVDMPPNGGNPALSEQDLFDIVAYIRTLEK
jgi:mono/diheme cytochrome c family protein